MPPGGAGRRSTWAAGWGPPGAPGRGLQARRGSRVGPLRSSGCSAQGLGERPRRLRRLHGRPPARGGEFDTVTCVAYLHHMPLEAALSRMAGLLRPGGRLLVIGLYANSSVADWLLSALMVVPAKALGLLRRESTYPAMVTALAKDSLGDIRAAAATLLPGALVRRRALWRYSLEWTKGPAARP
ncbi:class I SAM-dependent methyltransferase [Cryptobacterium curtum]|uniref:class I SAM-dependent methyltransferase n=1 Tax=Cryptobacterium curtum TaxID=84163 RepID=UPI0036F3FB0A